MNYIPNSTHWKIGDYVIHDADAKTNRMIMVVIGYDKDGLVKTRYLNPDAHSCAPRGRETRLKPNTTVYTNESRFLHDPNRADILEVWKGDLPCFPVTSGNLDT